MEEKYHINYNFICNPICYRNTLLNQLGRAFCSPVTVVETHAHLDWYELTIVTSGEGIVTTNGISTPVSEGDIYLSYPGDFHKIESSENDPLKYDFFSFNTKNYTIKRELKRIASTYPYNQRVFRDAQINTAVSNAISEMSSQLKYHNEMLSSLFEQILYYLLRDFNPETCIYKEKHTTSLDELCFQIMHYIDTNIYSIKNLSCLAEKFSYNYSYLSKTFKKNTGNTIADYYQSRRLEAARLLIIEGNIKFIDIAEMLNYSSLYTFSKAFKKKYGVSPRYYTLAPNHLIS